MVSLPLVSNCWRVTTVTGAGVVRSLRWMREPVTTISSVADFRPPVASDGTGTSAAGCGAAVDGVAAGCCVPPTGACAGDVASCCADADKVNKAAAERTPRLMRIGDPLFGRTADDRV